MGAGHGAVEGLHHPGTSLLHRLPAEAKILALVVFVVVAVATPARAVGALALDAGLLLALAATARLPLLTVLRRLRVALPFMAFAFFLPIVGEAPRSSVLGLSLSEPGAWAAWNIVAKATIGVLGAVVLSSTTTVPDLLAGLGRLHVPPVLTGIAGFMVRYLDVIVGEAHRTRIARLSRGDDPRWLWQARGVAATTGTLFVRSYERGERVHLAMLSRGFAGSMPDLGGGRARPGDWVTAALLPVAGLLLLLASRRW